MNFSNIVLKNGLLLAAYKLVKRGFPVRVLNLNNKLTTNKKGTEIATCVLVVAIITSSSNLYCENHLQSILESLDRAE